MAETTEKKYVRLIKTCVGKIAFTVTNPDTGVKQIVSIPSDGKERTLPINWAAYIYQDTTGGAYKMYKNNYFTFDDPDAVYNYAYNNGLIIGDVTIKEQSIDSSYLDEVKKALLTSDTLKLDKIASTEKGKDDLAHVARENIGSLKGSTRSYVEKLLGITLVAEGEEVK